MTYALRFTESMLFNLIHLKKGAKRLRFCILLLVDLFLFTFEILLKRPKASILIGIASPSSIGGTELQINKIAEYLIHTPLKPLVLTIGPIENLTHHEFLKRLQKQKIVYLRLGRFGQVHNKWLQSFAALLIKRLKASFYHCFNPMSASLIPVAKKAKLKIFYSETGLPKTDPWWEPLKPHIPSIDFAIAISATSLSNLRSSFDYQGPSAVLYSLIDHPPATPSKNQENPNNFHILYFGRMHVNKGIFLLLDAFRSFVLEYPLARLTFVGCGSDKNRLRQQIDAEKMEHQVQFLEPWNRQELYSQIVQYDLFCLPSFSEGSPCSILEAMSVGLPIVASRIGGIPELIEEGKSGLLVPSNDKMALVEAFSFLANNPEMRTKVGRAALKRYQDQFHSLNTLSQLRSIYEKFHP